VFKLLCDLLSINLPLIFWKEKNASQKLNGAQKQVMGILQSQKGHIVFLNLSDRMKVSDLFKGSMSLVKDEWCYVQNESSMCSI
jgi:hypothetical protein